MRLPFGYKILDAEIMQEDMRRCEKGDVNSEVSKVMRHMTEGMSACEQTPLLKIRVGGGGHS